MSTTKTIRFKEGDRVVCTSIAAFSGVPLGLQGIVALVSGFNGASIYPDPAKRMIFVEWDNGQRQGVFKTCLARRSYNDPDPFENSRIDLLKSAANHSDDEKTVRSIIRLHDGNVYSHEINAVFLKLYSDNNAFNLGRERGIQGLEKTPVPYDKNVRYQDYIEFCNGYETGKLAVAIHRYDKVRASL